MPRSDLPSPKLPPVSLVPGSTSGCLLLSGSPILGRRARCDARCFTTHLRPTRPGNPAGPVLRLSTVAGGESRVSDVLWVLGARSLRRSVPVSYTHLRAHETDSYLV